MTMNETNNNRKKWCFSIPQRFVVVFMCSIGLFNAYAVRSCLSVAITEMVDSSTETVTYWDDHCIYDDFTTFGNHSFIKSDASHGNTTKETYDWSEYTQGIILSSFYWGYLILQLPGGLVAEKYGCRHALGFGILIPAILTILTPMAVYFNESTALIIVRVIMGLAEGVTFPVVNVLLAKWAPPDERSRIVSFISGAATMGAVFATIVSGWILQYSSVGWPLVFYVMGAVGVVWYLFWLILGYNSPQEHPFISQEEVAYIENCIKEHTHQKPTSVPWRKILTSKPLWASTVAMMGFGWLNLSFLSHLPKYMSGVLKLSAEHNGYFTSLAYVCTTIGGIATSWLADYLIFKKKVSTTTVRKVFSVMALPISATFIVGVSYAGCDRVLAISLLVVSMTFMGTVFPSVYINTLDLSPNYAGTLMGLTNGMGALTGVAGPYVIGVLTPNQTLDEWRSVFWIMFGVASFCDLIFLVYGSGEVQFWNNPESQNEVDEKNRQRSGSQRCDKIESETCVSQH